VQADPGSLRTNSAGLGCSNPAHSSGLALGQLLADAFQTLGIVYLIKLFLDA